MYATMPIATRLLDDSRFLDMPEETATLLLLLYLVADRWGSGAAYEATLRVLTTLVDEPRLRDRLDELAGFVAVYPLDGAREGWRLLGWEDDTGVAIKRDRSPSEFLPPIGWRPPEVPIPPRRIVRWKDAPVRLLRDDRFHRLTTANKGLLLRLYLVADAEGRGLAGEGTLRRELGLGRGVRQRLNELTHFVRVYVVDGVEYWQLDGYAGDMPTDITRRAPSRLPSPHDAAREQARTEQRERDVRPRRPRPQARTAPRVRDESAPPEQSPRAPSGHEPRGARDNPGDGAGVEYKSMKREGKTGAGARVPYMGDGDASPRSRRHEAILKQLELLPRDTWTIPDELAAPVREWFAALEHWRALGVTQCLVSPHTIAKMAYEAAETGGAGGVAVFARAVEIHVSESSPEYWDNPVHRLRVRFTFARQKLAKAAAAAAQAEAWKPTLVPPAPSESSATSPTPATPTAPSATPGPGAPTATRTPSAPVGRVPIASPAWEGARAAMRAHVDAYDWRHWLGPVTCGELDADARRIVLLCADESHARWCGEHFSEVLERGLQEVASGRWSISWDLEREAFARAA